MNWPVLLASALACAELVFGSVVLIRHRKIAGHVRARVSSVGGRVGGRASVAGVVAVAIASLLSGSATIVVAVVMAQSG